jgi:transcriptional regulator with XRE-family HTH domain
VKQVLKDNRVPIFGSSPNAIIKAVAARAKARRLDLAWSRETLASRAGISRWTLKHFESTGQIALETLAKIAVVLDGVDGFAGLFAARPLAPSSIAELERLHPPPRKRGRTLS